MTKPVTHHMPRSSVADRGVGSRDSLVTRGNRDWLKVMISMLSAASKKQNLFSIIIPEMKRQVGPRDLRLAYFWMTRACEQEENQDCSA